MNFGLQTPQTQSASSAQPELPHQFQNWRDLLGECQRKPSKRHVHALRVATLRLVAEVDYWLQQKQENDTTNQVAKRWSKQAEKLRRALREVRETDVHLAKLASLRRSLCAPGAYQPRSSRQCLGLIGELQRMLKQGRRSAGKRLIADIEARRGRLQSASLQIESELSVDHPMHSESADCTVIDMWNNVVAEFPKLDAGSLHDFRKSIKKVRYRAELLAGVDPQTRRLAVALKGMQSAIGAWHDWHALARLASRSFRDRSRDGGLKELLETLTEESLQKALESCEGQIAQIRSTNTADRTNARALPQKIPVRRSELFNTQTSKHYA
jgi:CHAD domain-containing protein